jgi:hypothetical protein
LRGWQSGAIRFSESSPSRSDVKAEFAAFGAVLKLKKRRVKWVTRLPTERLATACWDPIVAKTTRREPASLLGIRPLQRSDSQFCPQVINRVAGKLFGPILGGLWAFGALNPACRTQILNGRCVNRRKRADEVKDH